MTETNIKKARALLLQEQRGALDKEKLIEDIVIGKNPLLTAGDIATRLGIPIEVFHQWVKNTDSRYIIPSDMKLNVIGNAFFDALVGNVEMNSFAKPDFYIGNYPRWTIETFRNWLRANLK